MAHHEMRVMQNKAEVARVSGRDFDGVEGEIFRYAMLYRVYGDVTVQRQQPSPTSPSEWFWKRHAFFSQPPSSAHTQKEESDG